MSNEEKKNKKYAPCRLESLNGVQGFQLVLQGRDYGHYPLDNGHDGASQIEMAINDAKDYNYDGIVFE